VVLVPEVRRKEGEGVVDAYRAKHPDESVKVAVWTFDDMLQELEARLPDNPDVAQFKGLVQASKALDILPMTEAELIEDNPARRQDISAGGRLGLVRTVREELALWQRLDSGESQVRRADSLRDRLSCRDRA
jgi:hypothetical protein